MGRVRYVSILTLVLVAVLAAAVPTNSAKLRNAVTVGGVMEHENKFQAIADGTDKGSGTPSSSFEYKGSHQQK